MIEFRCGDCVAGMQAMDAGSVSAIITSPPYNIGKAYGVHNDRMPEAQYLKWQRWCAAEMARVLSPDGSLFLNLGGKVSEPGWPLEVLKFYQMEFQLQNTFVWVKSLAVDGLTRGHYTPINSDAHCYSGFEYVFHLTKTGSVRLDRLAVGVPFADKGNLRRGTRGSNGDVHDAGNVWFLPYGTIQRSATDRPHPASFPVELPTRCLLLHGRERVKLALDPFAGLGTTGQACRELGLPFLGFDIDSEYVRAAQGLAELRQAA